MHEKNPFFFVSVLETAKPVSFQKHKKIRNNVKETTDKYHYGDHITALDRASTNPHRNQVQSMVSLFFSANRTCSVSLSLHLSCSPTSISIRTSTHTKHTYTHTHTHTLSLPPSRSFPLFSSPTFLHFFPHLFPALLRPFGFASITYPRLAFSRLDRSYGFWLRLARVPFVLPHPGLVSDSLTRTRSFPRSALLPS